LKIILIFRTDTIIDILLTIWTNIAVIDQSFNSSNLLKLLKWAGWMWINNRKANNATSISQQSKWAIPAWPTESVQEPWGTYGKSIIKVNLWITTRTLGWIGESSKSQTLRPAEILNKYIIMALLLQIMISGSQRWHN